MKMYLRFGAMIATSTFVMFVLMYLNTLEWAHVSYSETRVYMALVMGASMAVIMLGFMTHMLTNRRANIGIAVGSVILFSLALWLVRSQATVGDISYMKAMIPHHSIAIMTSSRARIDDARVRKLADEIIASQRREIAEMKALVNDIESHSKQTSPGTKTTDKLTLGPQVPPPDPAACKVPAGFRVEVAVRGLTFPTSVEFDDQGSLYIAEAGYSYGDPLAQPRILRISADGAVTTVARGAPLVGPVNDLLWHQGRLYVSHRGRISTLADDGVLTDLVTDLPSDGDHHNNQMTAGPDGKIYFGQGTATNSGVVGLDNYKMGWLPDHPEFHDVPARDIRLTGTLFASADPLKDGAEKARTAPFHAFGKAPSEPAAVKGQTKASGSILRMNPDGTELEVYAWGLRNPYGLMWSPDGTLFATENGFDDRGSRPVANDQEDIYIIKQDAWYGWPDYAMGMPLTDQRFKPQDKPQPEFVMTQHPPVERPWLNFPKHSAITKLDIGRSRSFGRDQIYVAFFGHLSPMTGEPPKDHGGHRVVRIDPTSKKVDAFFEKQNGHGQGHGESGGGGDHHGDQKKDESITAGPRRLMDVRFAPDGEAMYVVDFGSLVVEDKPRPIPETGVVWRILPQDAKPAGPPPNISAP